MTNPKSTYTPDFTVGDSIAHMLVEFGVVKAIKRVSDNEDSYSKVGIQSADVLKRVKKLAKENDLQGKRVVLSSGLSNIQIDKTHFRKPDFASIEKQLEVLEQSGAKITLIGVSNENPELSKYNAKLEEMAKQHGAVFATLPTTQRDPNLMHPAYQALVDSIKAANKDDASIPALSSEEVTRVQELLKKVSAGDEQYNLGNGGKHHDGVNGTLTPATGQAIHAFEKKHGLESPDPQALIKALEEAAGGAGQKPKDEKVVPPAATPSEAEANAKRLIK